MPHRVILICLVVLFGVALATAIVGVDRTGPTPLPPSLPQAVPVPSPDAEPGETKTAQTGPGPRMVPLQQAMRAADQRYRGRVIAAEVVPPDPVEASRGIRAVYALRMLTPEDDLLLIRIDAATGAFLETAGHDLERARNQPNGQRRDKKFWD